jgi:hypothetical protein
VDPRLHHLQGKAERVKPAELIESLRECYRDKAALRQRHLAAARVVTDYDFNNTYQYVINREEIQLQWLRDAIEDRAATVDEAPEVEVKAPGKSKGAQADAGLRRQVDHARRSHDQRPQPRDAPRHRRRNAGSQALLRADGRGPYRPSRAQRRWRENGGRRPPGPVGRRRSMTVGSRQ